MSLSISERRKEYKLSPTSRTKKKRKKKTEMNNSPTRKLTAEWASS